MYMYMYMYVYIYIYTHTYTLYDNKYISYKVHDIYTCIDMYIYIERER